MDIACRGRLVKLFMRRGNNTGVNHRAVPCSGQKTRRQLAVDLAVGTEGRCSSGAALLKPVDGVACRVPTAKTVRPNDGQGRPHQGDVLIVKRGLNRRCSESLRKVTMELRTCPSQLVMQGFVKN